MLFGYALAILFLGAVTNAHSFQKRETSLNWGPCTYYNFSRLDPPASQPLECATLKVPLDYTNPNSSTIDIQLLKVNATQQPSKGSVLYNPGGAGHSVNDAVAQTADILIE
jgi:hypothetical protein